MTKLHELVRGPKAMKNSFEEMLYQYLVIAKGEESADELWNDRIIKNAVENDRLTAMEVLDENYLYMDGGQWHQMGGVKDYAKFHPLCPAIKGYDVYQWSTYYDIKHDCLYVTQDTITKAEFVRAMRRFCKTSRYKEYLKEVAKLKDEAKEEEAVEKAEEPKEDAPPPAPESK